MPNWVPQSPTWFNLPTTASPSRSEGARPGASCSALHPPENVVTQELEESAHAVPDDGGAQVAHVHLLGDVGRGEIHHHLEATRGEVR